jgi:hypothetical protein
MNGWSMYSWRDSSLVDGLPPLVNAIGSRPSPPRFSDEYNRRPLAVVSGS